MSSSSPTRICQFYLRGRCHKSDCEFRHDSSGAKGGSTSAEVARGDVAPVCRFFLNGSCRFGDRCRFRHERDSGSGSGDNKGVAGASSSSRNRAPPSSSATAAPPTGARKLPKDLDSDDESIMRKGKHAYYANASLF